MVFKFIIPRCCLSKNILIDVIPFLFYSFSYYEHLLQLSLTHNAESFCTIVWTWSRLHHYHFVFIKFILNIDICVLYCSSITCGSRVWRSQLTWQSHHCPEIRILSYIWYKFAMTLSLFFITWLCLTFHVLPYTARLNLVISDADTGALWLDKLTLVEVCLHGTLLMFSTVFSFLGYAEPHSRSCHNYLSYPINRAPIGLTKIPTSICTFYKINLQVIPWFIKVCDLSVSWKYEVCL